ncbi:MAG: 2-hydroxyglutaryl-CoA dehydratase, partial [Chloroflexi bacterium]|nr:2-hydroxyglutaryl-CoA dehydratase [Chloroflexota bacterium]
MVIGAGVDVGSTQTKAILFNDDYDIVGRSLINTGANVTRAAD